MSPPIRILHLEDNRTESELISAMLADEGLVCEINRLESQDAFQAALTKGGIDLILADYSLPSFDGISALALAKQHLPDTPFIFVSGTIGEEVAIESIKNGATDYVLKQRLSRLVPSVQRALKEVQERNERKNLESMVLQSEKMAAMGQLAASVAHELNNPLTGVLGYVQLLLQGKGLSEQQRQDLESIATQSRRCQDIIQNLLQFSRKKDPKREVLPLGPLVDSTLRLVSHDFMKSGITIQKEIPDSLPPFLVDGSQLQQVFLNLMINAKHAMEAKKGGQLLIQAYQNGQEILIHFKDNGCGISKENLSKIFDLFFTTKPVGTGTGLGLSISNGIIKRHEGEIQVESEEGVGTTFTLRLPIVAPSRS